MASATDTARDALIRRARSVLARLEALPLLTPPQRRALERALLAAEEALERSTPSAREAAQLSLDTEGAAPQPGSSAAPGDTAPDGMVHIWSDGSCAPNPGPGGWGTIIERGGQREELSGAAPQSTNNVMELTGVIEGLQRVPPGGAATVTTDSQYVVKGITQWVTGWKKRGWRKADGEPVLNQPLWETLDALATARKVRWEWVRGHAGHPENERCDELANAARRTLG